MDLKKTLLVCGTASILRAALTLWLVSGVVENSFAGREDATGRCVESDKIDALPGNIDSAILRTEATGVSACPYRTVRSDLQIGDSSQIAPADIQARQVVDGTISFKELCEDVLKVTPAKIHDWFHVTVEEAGEAKDFIARVLQYYQAPRYFNNKDLPDQVMKFNDLPKDALDVIRPYVMLIFEGCPFRNYTDDILNKTVTEVFLEAGVYTAEDVVELQKIFTESGNSDFLKVPMHKGTCDEDVGLKLLSGILAALSR